MAPNSFLSRRSALQVACGCIGATMFPNQSVGAPRLARGCLLTSRGYDVYRAQGGAGFSITDTLLAQSANHPSTGNSDLDRELYRGLRIAADTLEVNPAFGFFDPDKFRDPDLDGMNAFAWEYDTGVPGTQGLVGFGATLFRNELFGYDETGTTVMTLIAHEFGHVLQAARGYLHSIPALKCEINADFLAGYYLGRRKITLPSVRVEHAKDLFTRIGRIDNGNENRTHGDSVERVAAASAGFNTGYIERASLNLAVEAGWRYIGYSPNL